MWNPDEKEQSPNKEELFEALKTSEHVRKYYGICDNCDGTYWIADLDLINSQDPKTKDFLREFLRELGKKPQPPPPLQPQKCQSGMSVDTRRRLDELYAKLTRLSLANPPRRYT